MSIRYLVSNRMNNRSPFALFQCLKRCPFLSLTILAAVLITIGSPRLRFVGSSGIGEKIAIIEDMDADQQMVVSPNEILLDTFEVIAINNGAVALRDGDQLLNLVLKNQTLDDSVQFHETTHLMGHTGRNVYDA